MTTKAVIFDMDDLMINSHPVHMLVFEALLHEYNPAISFQKSLSKEEELKFFGLKIVEVLSFLNQKYALRAQVDKMNQRFNELMMSVFEQRIESMPGLHDLLNKIKERNLLTALASSAKHAKIDLVLRKLGLDPYFDAIVSGEDEIEKGKPAPDIFLKAAEKLGVTPNRCLVFEDAKNGVAAAKAAGMKCIGVHNKNMWERLGAKQDLSRADLEVDSLEFISTRNINNI